MYFGMTDLLHFLSICVISSDDCMPFLRMGFLMMTTVDNACIEWQGTNADTQMGDSDNS